MKCKPKYFKLKLKTSMSDLKKPRRREMPTKCTKEKEKLRKMGEKEKKRKKDQGQLKTGLISLLEKKEKEGLTRIITTTKILMKKDLSS